MAIQTLKQGRLDKFKLRHAFDNYCTFVLFYFCLTDIVRTVAVNRVSTVYCKDHTDIYIKDVFAEK